MKYSRKEHIIELTKGIKLIEEPMKYLTKELTIGSKEKLTESIELIKY